MTPFTPDLTPDPAVDMSGTAHTLTLNGIFVQFVPQIFLSERKFLFPKYSGSFSPAPVFFPLKKEITNARHVGV